MNAIQTAFIDAKQAAFNAMWKEVTAEAGSDPLLAKLLVVQRGLFQKIYEIGYIDGAKAGITSYETSLNRALSK